MAVTHLTTAMASNAGSNFVQATGGITGTNISGTIFSNGISLSAGAGGAGDGYNIVGVNGNSVGSAATIQFSNSNNVTFGLAGSTVTASASYPAQSAFVFSNSNGVSFGTNGSTVTATVATNYQSQGAYLTTAMQSNAATISNVKLSAGTLSTNRSDMTFANGGGVSFGLETNGVITATVATNYQAPGAYLTTAALSQDSSKYAGINGAITGGSITVNTSGVSVNLPAYLTTAQPVGAYLTTARASNDAIGLNTALTANGLSVTANSSGLSINVPAWLITAAQSNHSHGNPTLALTNLTGTTASASNGLTISLSAAAPGAGGGAAISGGANSQSTGTVNFANSNGITFGLSNNGTMTASHNGLTTAMVSDAGSRFLNTGTTGATNASITLQSNGLSVSVGNYITTGALSNHSHGNPTLALTNLTGTTASASNGFTLSLSGNAAQTTQPVAVSGSNGSFNFSTLSFGNLNGLSFYTSNGSIVGSYTDGGGGGGAGTNTALNLTNLTGTLAVNTNGVSLSMSAAAPGGGAGTTLSGLQFQNNAEIITQTISNNLFHLQPFEIQAPVQYDRLVHAMQYTQASNSTLTVSVTARVGLYTLNGGTLSLVGSTSTSRSINGSGTASSSVNVGMRLFTIGSTTTINPGNYVLGVGFSTATSGANGSLSHYIISQIASNLSGLFGVGSNVSNQFNLGRGTFSVTTNAVPGSIAVSAVRNAGATPWRNLHMYFASSTV